MTISEPLPEFLRTSDPTPKATDEMKASSVRLQRVNTKRVMLGGVQETMSDVSKIIKCEDFSSLHWLIRITAYVTRFLHTVRGRQNATLRGGLTVNLGESCTTRSEERSKNRTVESTVGVKKLGKELYVVEDGLKGRKFHTLQDFKDRHLTTLIINDCHNRVGHNAVKEMLPELRSRFV